MIQELQLLVDDHPMYTSNRVEAAFQLSPTKVMERYNFDGRQFPAIVITTSSSTEKRLSMDRLLSEAYGHARPAAMMSYVSPKITDNSSYSGNYADAVYLLEFSETMAENDEEVKLKVHTVSAVDEDVTGDVTTSWYDVTPDERRTNIIDGVELHFGSFNDIRPGMQLYLETFKDRRYLGDIYGSRFDLTIMLSIYAQTQYETEELLDLVTAWCTYYIPHQLYYKHSIHVKTVNTDGVIEKEGKYGEEYFTGKMTLTTSVESQFFVPIEIMSSYNLWIALREKVNDSTGQLLVPVKTD